MTTFHLTISFSYENLYLRAGENATEQRLRAEGRGKYQQASRTSTEHGKLQAAQPESGCSMKAKAQRESRRRQENGWNKRITANRSLKIERDESPTQM